jgi:hypothetical protein
MRSRTYVSMDSPFAVNRRDFVKLVGSSAAVAGGIVLGGAALGQGPPRAQSIETNVSDFLKVKRTKHSLPGPFAGRVVKVADPRSLNGDKIERKVVAGMFEKGLTTLTGRSPKESFALLFEPHDVVGIKVNPVGAPLINTRPEVVDAVIEWLLACGLTRQNIVIWDRFDHMLVEAGFTPARFPGIRIEALQTMDENGNKWRDKNGQHVSAANFDRSVYYYVKGVFGKNVRGYKDDEFYVNQHVFGGEYSYFGKLLTQKLTKIINVPAYKNTGSGISMACKNLGYGAICNCGRLHQPLGLKTSTEVLAAPVIRDKLVLNVTDGLRGQYDGGPDKNAQFIYPNHALYFATDPFALDMICHRELMAKRRAMGREVNTHPRFTEYLHYGEKLGLGVANPEKITLVTRS